LRAEAPSLATIYSTNTRYRTSVESTSASLAAELQVRKRMRRMTMTRVRMRRCRASKERAKLRAPRKPRSRRFKLDNDKRDSLALWPKSF
jgi:hypothetical protein